MLDGLLMDAITATDCCSYYQRSNSPAFSLDCGQKCAPYNESGVSFCCDIMHPIPSAYQAEWEYLLANTNMRQLWQGQTSSETKRLRSITPEGQALIACLKQTQPQRQYRSIFCWAFPVIQHITRQGESIGRAYYWVFNNRCWVISNLETIGRDFRADFVASLDELINFRRRTTTGKAR